MTRRPGDKDGGPGDSCGQQGGGEGVQDGGSDRIGEAFAQSRKEPLGCRWAASKPAAKAHGAKAVEAKEARDAPGGLCLYRNIHEDMP